MAQEVETNKRAKSEIDLRKLMKKLGMGSNAFAEACGVSSQSMAQFLRPGKSLTTATIYRIANALDIDPRDMFFPVEEEAPQTDTSAPSDNLFSATNAAEQAAEQAAEAQADTKTPVQGADAVPQDAREMMYCPHCGTKFFVAHVPHA